MRSNLARFRPPAPPGPKEHRYSVLTAISLTLMLAFAAGAGASPNVALDSAELYNPAQGSSTLITSSMVSPRYAHMMTVLTNGTFLISGGYDREGRALARSEIYNPVTNTFIPTASMTRARVFSAVASLPDGTVLVAGGSDGLGHALSSAEIYNPVTGTFTATGSMHVARIAPVAMFSSLAGAVLVAGGYTNGPPQTVFSSVEFYYPVTGTFIDLSDSLQTPRTGEALAILDDDNVLLAGGFDNSGVTAGSEMYSTSTGISTLTGSLNTARAYATGTSVATADAPNLALVAGGFNSALGVLSSAELYNPAFGGFFVPTGPMKNARMGHSATGLPGGTTVAVAGGQNNSGQALASVEIYDADTNAFTTGGNTVTPRSYQQAAGISSNGSNFILMTGGRNAAGAAFSKPRFAFVSNGDGTISGYTVDSNTSRLRSTGYTLSGKSAVSLSVDPSNRFVYAVNPLDNFVSAYAIDPTTGHLNVIGTYATGLGPVSVSIDPSGLFLYVANQASNTLSVFSINSGTGVLQLVQSPATGSAPRFVAVAPQGELVYAACFNSDKVYAYISNPINGSLTPITGSPFSTGSGPASLTVDPTGHYLYAANQLSDNVSAFVIGQTTGALTAVAGSPFHSGSQPESVAAAPSGDFLYVGNYGSNNISAYSIDSGTGALTTLAGSPFPSGTNPQAVTADPSDNFLYVANHGSDNVWIYGINQTTGVLTNLGTEIARSAPAGVAFSVGSKGISYVPGFAYSSTITYDLVLGWPITSTGKLGSVFLTPFDNSFIAVDPTGRFAFSSDDFIFGINPMTGALTQLNFPVTVPGGSITVDPSARFLFTAAGNGVLVQAFNDTTYSLTIVPGSPFSTSGTNPLAVAVDPSNRFAYVVNQGSNTIAGFEINPVTGALTAIPGSPFAAGAAPNSLAVDPSGSFLYVADAGANNVSAFAINSVSGSLAPVTGSPFKAGSTPVSLFADPLDRFIYIANSGSNNVSAFSINHATGALSAIAGSPFAASGGQTNWINVDPSGSFAYALNYTTAIVDDYAINQTTGALTEVGINHSSGNPLNFVTTATLSN
jgi:6-phosphogluconolactonase (cycloisomerase 2 family)